MARLMSAAGAVLLSAALAAGAAPPPASAAPKPEPAKPTSIKIEGKDLEETLLVEQADRARLFENLLSEIRWMATATPQTAAPKADKLGPKYVVTVLAKAAPTQVYELFPLAAGGPRAHRPAAQPGGKKADGWFYGRLTMSETLRHSGVPLNVKPDVVNGGIGGGIGEDINAAPELDPVAEVNDFVSQMRRLMLLNGAILMLILGGLAGMAYLIRRRV